MAAEVGVDEKLVHIFTLVNWLQRRIDRANIEYVTMDTWQPCREGVQLILPKSTIIVDKYHVLALAKKCLDDARKSIRNSLAEKQRRQLKNDRFILLRKKLGLKPEKLPILESWTKMFPKIGEVHIALFSPWEPLPG